MTLQQRLTFCTVVVRVPHRSFGAVFPAGRSCIAGAAEAEWDERRPLFQRRDPSQPDARHLYEEEGGACKIGAIDVPRLIIFFQLDSIFRVLEPVGDKINEKVKAPAGLGSRLGFRSTKSEWFRIYRVGGILGSVLRHTNDPSTGLFLAL